MVHEWKRDIQFYSSIFTCQIITREKSIGL